MKRTDVVEHVRLMPMRIKTQWEGDKLIAVMPGWQLPPAGLIVEGESMEDALDKLEHRMRQYWGAPSNGQGEPGLTKMNTSTTTLAALGSTDVLYACMVTDCWESWQESLHKTKRGAWQAGREWLLERYQRGYESRRICGKGEYDFMNKYQSFRVVPVTVMP